MLRTRTYLVALAAWFGSAVACGSGDDNALMRPTGVVQGGTSGAADSGGGGTGGTGVISCVNTRECPSPLVCSDSGQCVQCVVDAECAATQHCIGNACRNPCTSNAECLPDGLLCDRTANFCVQCLENTDCAPGVTCNQGRCGQNGGGSGGTPGAGGTDGTTGGSPSNGGTPGSGGDGLGGSDSGGAPSGGNAQTGGSDTGGIPSTGGTATGGFATGGTPPSTCGNGAVEPAESCEDTNHDFDDGCTPACRKEPDCSSGTCVTTCGDGIVVTSANEQCDDGNIADGDGCSSTCQIESGYNCSEPSSPSTLVLPMVLRDFDANGADFEPTISGSDSAVTGIVQATLVDHRPAFSGTNSQQATADFATLFPDWYRDASRNAAAVTELVLYPNGQGGYVNRWGSNGEQWTAVTYPNGITWCSDTARHDHCAVCPGGLGAGETCFDNGCTPWNNQQECKATVVTNRYDGNPTFFPLDGKGWAPSCQGTDSAVASDTTPCAQAHIPPAYMNDDTNWVLEPGGAYHNFSFTTETRFWFYYDSARTYQLDFQGDDDVWVFVNRTLAIDLGGVHTPVSGGAQLPRDAEKLGLTSGGVYEVAIFQAERQTTGSTYKLTLTGFNLAPSVCTR